jgi:hypothetical protein
MAMEVISRDNPDLLVDAIPQLIDLASTDTVSQVKWHIAEILTNVPVTDQEAEQIVPILLVYLADKSKIVKYCAVQALGMLGKRSPRCTEIADRISALADQGKSLDKAVRAALARLRVE